SAFNILCTILMLPLSGFLEKLVIHMVPDGKEKEETAELDERLLTTPPLALEQCRAVTGDLARAAEAALKGGLRALTGLNEELAEEVRAQEERTDHYEDLLGTYLVKLSARPLSGEDNRETAKLLRVMTDFERIGDHGVNLLRSAEALGEKEVGFTDMARQELGVMTGAVEEVLSLSLRAFLENDLEAAGQVEPLEQVIDGLKEEMRTRHILRLQRGECGVAAGFVWSDLLTDLERVADHCSNIAGCVIDTHRHNLNLHETLREVQKGEEFQEKFRAFQEKYALQ
ncbi:MAG: Na/Pi cotransporter family protein, partial [Oscillospiraceae bacterium]|nr:Na/Pi cotransporter family protein [Oscillospiraceae bacterium]